MSKNKEELNNLTDKLDELTSEELDDVTGGIAPGRKYWGSREVGAARESADTVLTKEELEQVTGGITLHNMPQKNNDEKYVMDIDR